MAGAKFLPTEDRSDRKQRERLKGIIRHYSKETITNRNGYTTIYIAGHDDACL